MIVNPRRFLMAATAFAVLLFVVHIILTIFPASPSITRLAHMNDETSISTWYSASLLLLASVALYFTSFVSPQSRHLTPTRWRILSLIFAFLSMDEASAIHELGDRLHGILKVETATTFLWTLPYGLAVIALAATYGSFLLYLPRRTRNLFLLSGVVFLSGALGLEWLAALLREYDLDRFVLVTIPIEELLEMLGTSCFIYAILEFIFGQGTSIHSHSAAPRASRPPACEPIVVGFEDGSTGSVSG